MKIFKIKIALLFKFLFILLISISFTSFIGEPEEINDALKTGNTNVLKQKMNSTIELVILDKENIYSNIQAEQILKQFFLKHKPIGFEVLHNGSNESSQYYIGNLKTQNETFRVYYLLKNKDKEVLMFQLRIEKDE